MSTTRAAPSASSASLLSPETRAATIETVRAEYRKVAEAHERSEADKIRVPLAKARANALQDRLERLSPRRRRASSARARIDWNDLADLARYIDWTPFFQTWELKGRYPAILDDPEQGAAARRLFDDAQAMLKRIIDEHWFAPKAVVGFWPAAQVGDDIQLFADDSRATPIATLYTLRQQLASRDGRPNVALADFVAPPRAARAIMSAPSSSPPASRKTRSPSASSTPTTIIRRSSSRRSPTVSPRLSPRRCTRACAASSGATRRTRRSRPTN